MKAAKRVGAHSAIKHVHTAAAPSMREQIETIKIDSYACVFCSRPVSFFPLNLTEQKSLNCCPQDI